MDGDTDLNALDGEVDEPCPTSSDSERHHKRNDAKY